MIFIKKCLQNLLSALCENHKHQPNRNNKLVYFAIPSSQLLCAFNIEFTELHCTKKKSELY